MAPTAHRVTMFVDLSEGWSAYLLVDNDLLERNLPDYLSVIIFASLYYLSESTIVLQSSDLGIWALDGRIIAAGDAISDIYEDDRLK